MRRYVTLPLIALSACSNFNTVEAGQLYRSAQPSGDQLRDWIVDYDVRTVVRLLGGKPGEPSYDASHEPTVEAGIAFRQIPMSAGNYPSRETLLALLDTFEHAEYPILVHCRAGADRSGLASAVYVLTRHGDDLDRARGQLSVWYLHTGFQNTRRLGEVLWMYAPHRGAMTFAEWARELYAPPFRETVRWGQ